MLSTQVWLWCMLNDRSGGGGVGVGWGMNNERFYTQHDLYSRKQTKEHQCGQQYGNAPSCSQGPWQGCSYSMFSLTTCIFFWYVSLTEEADWPARLPNILLKEPEARLHSAEVIKSIYGLYSDTFILLYLSPLPPFATSHHLHPAEIHTLSHYEHIV